MKSTMYSLEVRDFLRGLIMAIGTPILPIFMQSINAGNLVFDWKLIGITALGGFLTYIVRKFLTDDIKAAQKTLMKANVEALNETEEKVL